MTGESLILAFDVGTTSTKSCLYRMGSPAELIGSAMESYPIKIQEGGRAEQNPEEWVDALILTTGRILEETGVSPSAIKGLSFSSQMQGLVLVGRDGMPLRPAMSYMDQRAVEVKRKFSRGPGIDDIPPLLLARSIAVTGIAPTSVKDPLWKYLWVKENEKELFSWINYWLDVKDFLIYRLTGEAVCTEDSACATGLFDNRPGRGCWSLPLCRAYGVDPGHLPRIIGSSQVAGGLTGTMAARMGLAEDTPVFGGGGDASTIGLGAGAVEKNRTHIYMGTSGWVSAVTDRRMLDIKRKIASITCAVPGRFHYFCEQETSGKCLEWVRDHLAIDEIGIYLEKISVADDPESIYRNLFEYLNEVIGGTPAGSGDVLFTPWLHGNRSPFEDPHARGMFFNLGLNTGKSEMIRAVVEGLAYNSRWMLESIEERIPRQNVLRFVGGGALSPVTAQILADVTGRELEVPENPHNAGALGAALIAAWGMGWIDSPKEIPAMIPLKERFRPDRKDRAVYEKQYRVFRELYRKNRNLFYRMNR